MARLIDDLLDVSRISQRKIHLKRESIELATILKRAVESTRHHVEAQHQELGVSLAPDPIYLEADPTRLEQVFGNLLHNASKYNGLGGHIWLTVELTSDGRQPGEVHVRVRDDGIGINADHLPHVFEMSEPGDSSHEHSGGGLGIGLSLAKMLTEMHGGTIEAHSAGPGKGSEFVVRLPLRADSPSPKPPQELSDRKKAVEPQRRILVVDDNRDSATFLSLLLKGRGHEVCTTYAGLEALQAATAFRPEVVLLDIGLPELDGYEVSRRMREEPWGKDALLLALTGWGHESDRLHSKEAGFDGHLVKPVECDELMKLLAELRPKPA